METIPDGISSISCQSHPYPVASFKDYGLIHACVLLQHQYWLSCVKEASPVYLALQDCCIFLLIQQDQAQQTKLSYHFKPVSCSYGVSLYIQLWVITVHVYSTFISLDFCTWGLRLEATLFPIFPMGRDGVRWTLPNWTAGPEYTLIKFSIWRPENYAFLNTIRNWSCDLALYIYWIFQAYTLTHTVKSGGTPALVRQGRKA